MLVSGFLVLLLVALVGFLRFGGGNRDAWADAMRKHLAEEGRGFNAMGPVVEALDRIDWEALEDHQAAMEAATRSGWKESPELAEVLRVHQPVVVLIGRSAALPNASFPSLLEYEADRPLPRFDRLHLLALLLTTNARAVEAEGSPAEAVQRLVELATLGSRFARPAGEASFAGHGLSITMIESAVGLAGEIVRSQPMDPATLERLERQLGLLEQQYQPLRSAAYDELDLLTHLVRNRAGSPEEFAVILQYYDTKLTRPEARKRAADRFGLVASLPGELERLRAGLDADLAAPFPKRALRSEADIAAASTNPLVTLALAPLPALAIRETIMLTRLRLVRQLCLVKMGLEPLPVLQDPFTGEPLAYDGERIISAGPDGRIDGAPYQPVGARFDVPGDLMLAVR